MDVLFGSPFSSYRYQPRYVRQQRPRHFEEPLYYSRPYFGNEGPFGYSSNFFSDRQRHPFCDELPWGYSGDPFGPSPFYSRSTKPSPPRRKVPETMSPKESPVEKKRSLPLKKTGRIAADADQCGDTNLNDCDANVDVDAGFDNKDGDVMNADSDRDVTASINTKPDAHSSLSEAGGELKDSKLSQDEPMCDSPLQTAADFTVDISDVKDHGKEVQHEGSPLGAEDELEGPDITLSADHNAAMLDEHVRPGPVDHSNKDDNRQEDQMNESSDDSLSSLCSCNTSDSSESTFKESQLQTITSLLDEARSYESSIDTFEGDSKDKAYLILSESLMSLLLKLDLIDTNGDVEVREARRNAVHDIQNSLLTLDSKCSSPLCSMDE